MLEKIGLPPKPSMRGAAWVVDASHCQGCSAQFSLFTRKHHCQRCGGLFCSGCSQQKMVLRGQGDSPVRICDPCKTYEEAARYELRYGHKNRAAKANAKAASKPEDEILGEILGGDGVQQFSHRASLDSEFPARTASAPSSSTGSRRTSATFSIDGNGNGSPSTETRDYELNNSASIFTPEELRQQAAEEKKRYKTLKSERKPEEALQAFKHGKELERQAAALELELRKSRRMSTKSHNVNVVVNTQKIDDSDDAETKRALAGKRVRKEKDNDIASELRDLGWSDADLHDETKTTAISVEGELSQILREVAPKSSEGKKTSGIDKSQVNALKRQALMLKREGRLAEAKEELKKAKILERQLEEQEILGEAEESDDDLAAIIQNMDDDNQDDLLLDKNSRFPAFSFEQIMGASNDLAFDGNFDVTDDDMNDPDMSAALKSFGWNEEDDKQMNTLGPSNEEALKEQALALKGEAVMQKRAGNVAEAMSLLKKAKQLEKYLETERPESDVPSPEGHKSTRAEDATVTEKDAHPVSAPKSKLAIQKELLALKKKALALRREGKADEAEEELKKGSILEKQLEELENSSNRPVTKDHRSLASTPPYKVEPASLDLADVGPEPEVTDSDMQDPALLSVLKNMGWDDDETHSVDITDKPSSPSPVVALKPKKNRGQIQKELLAIKRKAFAFRREGKNIEAEEELEKAKVLEQQLAEIEELGNLTASQQGASRAGHVPSIDASVLPSSLSNTVNVGAAELGALMDPPASSSIKPQNEAIVLKLGHASKESSDEKYSALSRPVIAEPLENAKGSHSPSDVLDPKENKKAHGDEDTLRDEILLHKRKAVAFKREGKLAEAREELKLAKLLEKRLEGAQQNSVDGADDLTASFAQQNNLKQQPGRGSSHIDAVSYAPPVQEDKSVPPPKAMSSRDRLKIQRESLTHKRNALKLRREGKITEADAELELAKSLEGQLEESENHSSNSGGKSAEANDMVVEDLLDPQMMSALKSIGWSDADLSLRPSNPQPPKKAEVRPAAVAASKPQSERTQLEEQIKAEKLKALTFKREGKQAEALEALRSAKRLERKLLSLG